MWTGRQRWVTTQGKASDQHPRFLAEGIWGTSVEHMIQIQKKSQKLSSSHCSYQHPAVQHPLCVTRHGGGYAAAWAWSWPAQLWPGLGRVWVLIVWHCKKQQETRRCQLKRKMRNAPQRWTLNKERHLTSDCKPSWKTNNKTRSFCWVLMNYHNLPVLLRYLYISITVIQKHVGFLIPRIQEAPPATYFRYENWDTEGKQVHIPCKGRSVDPLLCPLVHQQITLGMQETSGRNGNYSLRW